MPALPAVFVELKANISEFKAKMGEAQGEIKKLSSTTGLEQVGQAGKVAFLGIAGAATIFGGLAVKAALEGESAHAQLAQAVANTGVSFKAVSPAIEEMSGKFAKLGFENDTVEAALAKLVQVTGNVKTSMANMGLVADFARGRHIELADAATVVGKVMGGNVTALSRLGFATKDAAGNTMSAVEALTMLKDRFGGDAAAQADTYSGKLAALNAEWHNMLETVGGMILPVLASLAGKMADVAGWFQKHTDVALALAGAIGGPLAVALGVFIVRQAIAFGESVAGAIGNVVKAVFSMIPAIEAATAAEEGLGIATIIATGGLALVGAGAAVAAAHFLIHGNALKDVTGAAAGTKGAVDGVTGSEGALAPVTDAATKRLQEQSDMFKQLNGDTSAQESEILKLIGDIGSQQKATQALTSSSGANSEATKWQVRHTTDLASAHKSAAVAADTLKAAQDKLTVATDTYNKLKAGVGNKVAMDESHANHNLEQAKLSHETAQTKLADAVTQYGENSVEARQASLDLETATYSLTDAQDAMGHVGETAWNEVNNAQKTMEQSAKDVVKATDDQTAAQKALRLVLADRGAIAAAVTDAQNLATNSLAAQSATHQLNADWAKFDEQLALHPELRKQVAQQLSDMKSHLPTGADVKPLDDFLTHMANLAPAILTLGTVLPGLKMGGPPAAGPPVMGPALPAFALPAFGVPGGATTISGPININVSNPDVHATALAVRDELIRIGRGSGNVASP